MMFAAISFHTVLTKSIPFAMGPDYLAVIGFSNSEGFLSVAVAGKVSTIDNLRTNGFNSNN